MKNYYTYFFLITLSIGSITACGTVSNDIEVKLNQLNKKTETLDSLINKEVDKVLTLDSLVKYEADKIKQLDSLVNTSSSKLDSIANQKRKSFENLIR